MKLKTLAGICTFGACMAHLTTYAGTNSILQPASHTKLTHNEQLQQALAPDCGIGDNGQDWSALQRESKQYRVAKMLSRPMMSKSIESTSLPEELLQNSVAVPGRYYIPVVFHVYGDEYNCADETQKCLTDDKIQDALTKLNNDFQGLSIDSPEIAPQFQAIRENLNIEFVLAGKDPQGNDTSGIVRHAREQKGYGNYDDETLAQIQADAWDNFSYMNVYLMHDLYDDGKVTKSGVAWYPELAMTEQGTARVVYNGHYVGNNTSENFRSVLTHEFGHWLNLIHTFETNQCSITNEAFCDSTGDRSCDTPQMSMPKEMQNNAPNCLGQPTNTENFMHYSDNYAMFTQEQVVRMTAALHNPARNTLWSNENLIAAGLSQYVSNSERPWDGVSGLNVEPSGKLLASHDIPFADKGAIETFEVNLPFDAKNILFYLNGHTEDPDMYVSKGQAPTAPTGDSDQWVADIVSFNSAGERELATVDIPDVTVPYYASIHAFTSFSNSKFNVLQGEDPYLKEGEQRYSVLSIDNLWANKSNGSWSERPGKTYDFQFSIPEEASRVVVVVPGGYQGPKMADGSIKINGDLDLYVAKNRAVSKTDFDCRPFTWKGISEYCEFQGGGDFDLFIEPFETYSNASIQVYYEIASTQNQLPFANVNGKTRYEAKGHALEFTSNGSNDPDGSIVSYLWDFGDGTQSTDPQVTHAYSDTGTYTVRLTVTDNTGNASTAQATAVITELSPQDAPLCSDCERVYLADELNLATHANGHVYRYEFAVPDAASLVTFELVEYYNGDPDIHVSRNQPVSKSQYDCRPWEAPNQTELCQFEQGGVYQVMIDPFKDYESLRFRAYYDIHRDADHSAPNRLPVADAGGNQTVRAGVAVQLDGTRSSDQDGTLVEYKWDLNHGLTYSGAVVAHHFERAGSYPVTLTVTDDKNASASVQVIYQVLPIGDYDQDGNVDTDDINAISAAIAANLPIDSSFDINGDGVVDNTDVIALEALCSFAECSNIPPAPQPPVAHAQASTSQLQIGQQVDFSSAGSDDQYGQITAYQWGFGDGTQSNFANPTHSYEQAGIYQVTLTVTDNDNMTANTTITVNVDHPPLTDACADFDGVYTRALAPNVPRCINGTRGHSFAGMDRGPKTVAITLINAPSDAKVYFGDGHWPKTDGTDHDAVSFSQGNQQCLIYEINEQTRYWGYLQISGDATGATIVVDYDVAGCRPL
ncbi:PKD domain-containing protein [Pseudoalteromonas sp. S16_S37]|uniref:PKD domain-containing protein n=1 Tax=Pseudoalteromonas sp. S16_S37 TaxID=2720228 RepID=UPI001680F75F|nr:PKD domain-containing protein [Pseudoalteromonas sp. S16_S37]MBD1584454.1 PKD domain-containing protein [Pseudoalteromonas sp. S16_S37]